MRTTCRTMGTRTALEKMKALLQQLKSDVDHQSVVATVPFSPLGLNCRTFHAAFFLPPLSFLASIQGAQAVGVPGEASLLCPVRCAL